MGPFYFLLMIIIVFGGFGLGYVVLYNLIQYSKTKIDQAEHIIDETLRDKYDLILRANNMTKGVLKEDKSYFNDLEILKDMNISNFDLDRKLAEYIQLFEQLKGDFKELNDNKGAKDITLELKDINVKLSASKSYYNKYVTDYNRYITFFPANIIAKIHRFNVKNFFDNKDMNDNILDDFKL